MEFEFSSLEKFFILFIARFILHGFILNKFRIDVRTQHVRTQHVRTQQTLFIVKINLN